MSVKPETLQNPERGLELQHRDAEGKANRKREEEAAAELELLRQRIAGAKVTTPKDPIPHCGDCFRRGWAAALRTIAG